jgi:tetratricopeptide (TPR) repeat protein
MTRGSRRAPALIAWTLVVALAGGCAWLGAETPDSLMKAGQQLYLDKKYDEALMKFERVIELDSTRWLAYVYIARSYMAKGSWTLAATNARLAYEAEPGGDDVLPTFTEALLGGGAAALRTGQFTKAVADFSEYTLLHGTDARGYLGLGQAYVAAGRYREAVGAFARGLQNDRGAALRQDLLKGLLDGGTRALQQGEATNAVGLLREYLQQNPRDAAAYVMLGKALLASGHRSDAMDALGKAVQINPGQLEATDLLHGLR